ncbi:BglG family transcription antiterminator [Streptococcus sp. S784/96/1]|uniref:BglG family transcription antiterminator n=1 Tax=Streptococcus sp. S784/96/1 TaxID=2653499 RepID=UPI00138A5F83|nr:PRD domain-containing protein [Streptococcus sp. S784/96/1]
MLTKKEARIIQLLSQHRDSFVRSRELADELGCSDRTIRNYYKTISEKLSDYAGVDIISKQGNGYALKVSDERTYSDFIKENHITLSQKQYVGKTDINDRYNYILNKLLFEQNEIYFDDLADELYVSRSTLSADFKKIRQKFLPYHLKIESKANKGVYVTGTERDKRRFIMDYFIDSDFLNTMHSYVDNELLNQKISFEEMTIIVLDECREGQLKLSDFVIQNLVIHIALALRRIAEGFKIAKITDEDIKLKETIEHLIAERILMRIASSTGIDFPEEEADYITLHLLSKSYGSGRYESEDLHERLRHELLASLRQFDAFVQNDFQLIEGLLVHLSTLLIRLESHVALDNPLTADIQSNYGDMYHWAELTIAKMPLFERFQLSADELAYIALHFMAGRERYKEKYKYNILVICATGYGSAQMLKSRIENELGQTVHISDVIGYYEINDDKLQGIDFIISSIDLSNLIFNVPVFTVSVFLTKDEVITIKDGISKLRKSKEILGKSSVSIDYSKYFDDYFSEELFIIVDEIGKAELMEKMIAQLAVDEEPGFSKRMCELLTQRELMSSVVFSDTIAVPHPIKAVASNHHIAVAIIKNGMWWDEQYPSIKFVFLTSMSTHDNEGLPEMASMIVDLVDCDYIQEKLMSCQHFEQFRELFLSIEKGRE